MSVNIQNLLDGLVVALSDLSNGGVLVERRVGGAKAGVGGGVDPLLLEVGEELGRGVVGVELDLVDGRDDLYKSR